MVGDLFVDLRSGHNLITLLELLTQERLVSLVSLLSLSPVLRRCTSDIHGRVELAAVVQCWRQTATQRPVH